MIKKMFIFMIIINLFMIIFLNTFFSDVFEINEKMRNYITKGKFKIREISDDGIPISYNSRFKKPFISPFYVVHYGLIYSETISNVKDLKKRYPYIWFEDNSVKFWDDPPEKFNEKFFKNCADYIVKNIKLYKGNYHLLYDFDWPYENMRYKIIKAPWWSGLTDGYAILLLLRAYTVYKDEIYLESAKRLYLSVLSPIENGGSLTNFNGYPWIEEYVNWRFPEENPKVFNGMVYAYYGIRAYENFNNIKPGMADKLLISIFYNARCYDLNYWSYYDAVKTVSNVKYHKINYGLLKDLYEAYSGTAYIKNKEDIKIILERWKKGADIPILWLYYSGWSVSKIHLLIEIIFLESFFIFILRKFYLRNK
jgi:hypothetical protein